MSAWTRLGMRALTAALVMASSFLANDVVLAQDDTGLRDRCQSAGLPADAISLCLDAVSGLELLQPEGGLLMVGGNPVLGTASPIGTRFRFIPRFQVGARINVAFVDLPDVLQYPESSGAALETLGFAVPMPQFDLSVGVFDGFSLTPTVGGLASVELLGSASALILPGDEGFQDDATAFGLGARVGLLRESFTAPGLSISGMYKWMDRVQFGSTANGDDAQFGTDLNVFSFRAAASKSFVILGIAAGIGWDHYSSDVDLAVETPGGVVTVVPEGSPEELESDRWSAFVDLSYILLFFNFVAEAGWQESETITLSTGDQMESGNFFGAIGVRLTL